LVDQKRFASFKVLRTLQVGKAFGVSKAQMHWPGAQEELPENHGIWSAILPD